MDGFYWDDEKCCFVDILESTIEEEEDNYEHADA